MYCSNCGSNINQGEIFCRMCGTKIVSQSVQQNSMVQQNINQQNYAQSQPDMPQQVMNNNVGYNQPMYNGYSNDEALLDAYIGVNVDKIKSGDFSWCYFGFGPFYALYRKMWLLGILGLLCWLVFLVLKILGLYFFVTIAIAFQFKKWYLKHAKEQVNKIKTENPNTSYKQLLMICNKKGGTTFIPLICLFFFVIFVYILLMLLVPTVLDKMQEKGALTSAINVDGKQLVQVVAWYDNEMGYSYQMVRTAKEM